MTFAEMQTDLEAILGTDLGYYKGDADLDTATVDFDVERKRLLNWAYRTTSKLCYIVDASVPFEPVEDQGFYRLQEPQGITQIIDLGSATIGTYTLSITLAGSTTTTGAINWNSSASAVDTALEAIIGATLDATVTAVAQGFKVVFSGTGATPPLPLLVMNSSLTATGNPAVRQAGLGKRCVKVNEFSLNDIIAFNQYAKPGLYNKRAFKNRNWSWRQSDSDTPRVVVDWGSRIQLFPAPDDAFILASSGNNFVEAQVILDDMINDNDVPDLPIETHEGMVLLASFRATDPALDEDGALRRMASANARWTGEVKEIRAMNKASGMDMTGRYVTGQVFRT